MSEGSRWNVVDDLLYETLEYHHTRRWSCRTMVLRSPTRRGATRPSPVRTIDGPLHVARRAVGRSCVPTDLGSGPRRMASDLFEPSGSESSGLAGESPLSPSCSTPRRTWSSGRCWSGCHGSPTADSGSASALEGRRPIIDPGHGRRLVALRRTRMALRPIACNAAEPYLSGDEPNPPKGAVSRGGSANAHSLPSVPDRVRRRRGRLHLPHGPRGAGGSHPLGRRAGRVAVALPDGHDPVVSVRMRRAYGVR